MIGPDVGIAENFRQDLTENKANCCVLIGKYEWQVNLRSLAGPALCAAPGERLPFDRVSPDVFYVIAMARNFRSVRVSPVFTYRVSLPPCPRQQTFNAAMSVARDCARPKR